NAVDFILNYSRSILERSGSTNIGRRSKRLRLYIPDGSYYLTEPDVFFRRPGVSSGTQAGYIIEGNGPHNSVLVYCHDSDSDQFLFNDQNQFPDMSFGDFGLICGTGKENIFLQYSTGNSQNYDFYNIRARHYHSFLKITGTGNADKVIMNKVQAYSLEEDNC